MTCPQNGVAGDRAGEPTPSGGPIGRRLALALAGMSILTLVVVGVLFYGFLGRYVLEQRQEQMHDHAVEIAAQVERAWDQAPFRGPGAIRSLGMLLRVDLQVLPRGAGIVIFREGSAVAVAGAIEPASPLAERIYEEGIRLADEEPSAGTIEGPGDTNVVIAASPVSFGDDTGLTVVFLPVAEAVSDRSGLFAVLVVSGVVGVGVAIVLGFVLGSWLTRPLRRLADAARSMASGSYDEPVTGSYPGEVYELASGLETARREVKRSEESLRSFVASAAHELRTPLTSIQGFSQALLDGTASSSEEQQRASAAIHRESGRLRRLVDMLLTLSRYDSRQFEPRLEDVDVTRLVAEEVDRLTEAGNVPAERISIEGQEELPVRTDTDMLRQAVANLLRNAGQYGAGEPIVVKIRRPAGGGRSGAEIAVVSGAAPLPPVERERVFERFYRGTGAGRSEGFGLGLALVKEICDVLGGTVYAGEEDGRVLFSMEIP